jgi:zinc transport system permease protein
MVLLLPVIGTAMNIPDLISLFSLPFMQRAILGGILLGMQGGILGSFVVLRRLSLFGDTVGHAAILGVVLGALLHLSPTWSLIGFTSIYGLAVIYLAEKTNLGRDTVLSIVLAGSVALGTIAFNFVPGYRGGLLSVLLGDILSIDSLDLILLSLLLIVTIVSLVITWQAQILLTLNTDLARVQGIKVRAYQYVFILLLSLTIALTIRSVGVLLANAFLVIPAATAKLICRKFAPFLAVAVTVGSLSGALGMIVSGIANLPAGPTIILTQLFIFLVVSIFPRK